MPQTDRYWPLGIVGSIVLLAASLTLGVWFLVSLFALPQRIELAPLTDLGDMGGTVIWVGGSGGLVLLGASRGARRRERARRRALRGDLSAMPLAAMAADPAKAPDPAGLPLVLPWRRRPRGREWIAPAVIALMGGSVLVLPVFLVVLAGRLGIDPQALGSDMLLQPIPDLIAVALILALDICLAVAGLVGFVAALSSRLGPAYGVVADDEGISTLHLKGPGTQLRWGDVRLLEVSHVSGSQVVLIFTLYGSRASVYWQDFKNPWRKRLRPEMSREEFEARQLALLALIASRTGLQPRTSSVQLMNDDELARRPTLDVRALAYSVGYGVAGALILIAVAVLALPLTPYPLLNWYAAITTAVAGVVVALHVWQALRPARTPSPQSGPQFMLPAAPWLTSDAIEMAYRPRFSGRLQDLAIGVVLLLDVVPSFAAHVNPPTPPPLAFAARAVADLQLVIGIVGMLAIVYAFSSRRTTLIAAADGLCERKGQTTTQLNWDAIVWLTVEMDKGNPNSFTVLGHSGEMITWPARGVTWRAGHPGQPSIGPEELAAIVADRSGVELVIREA